MGEPGAKVVAEGCRTPGRSKVGSCREARDACVSATFQLAVLDIDLPDGDGVALAAELIGLRPWLRLAICSGGHAETPRDRAPRVRMAVLTIKPPAQATPVGGGSRQGLSAALLKQPGLIAGLVG